MAIFPIEVTPLTVALPIVWYDASTTPTGLVSSWIDKSGRGLHSVQASSSLQPTCTASQLNNKNGLIFGDIDALITTFGFNTSATCTIFALMKFGVLPSGTNLFAFDGIDITNRQSLDIANSNGKFTFGTNTGVSGSVNGDLNPHIHSMEGGSTGAYWIDGVNQYTNTNVGTSSLAGITFNARYTGGNNGDCIWFEFLYYPYKFSTAQRQSIERYLANKWGVSTA